MTTLNMLPITGPGGKDRSRLYDHNGDRGYYSYYGMYGDEYGSNRNMGYSRPVFKIIINPKSHCSMHNGFEPYEYVESRKYQKKDVF